MLPLTCISRPSSFIFQQKIKESQWKLIGFHETEHNPSEVWEFLLWSWQTGIFLFFFLPQYLLWLDFPVWACTAAHLHRQRGVRAGSHWDHLSKGGGTVPQMCSDPLKRLNSLQSRLTGADSTQVSFHNSKGYQLTGFSIGAPKGCAELNPHITWRVQGSRDKSWTSPHLKNPAVTTQLQRSLVIKYSASLFPFTSPHISSEILCFPRFIPDLCTSIFFFQTGKTI